MFRSEWRCLGVVGTHAQLRIRGVQRPDALAPYRHHNDTGRHAWRAAESNCSPSCLLPPGLL